jgi:hypothetical protein
VHFTSRVLGQSAALKAAELRQNRANSNTKRYFDMLMGIIIICWFDGGFIEIGGLKYCDM